MHWWVADYIDQPVILGSWIFWVVISITLHELGHGYVAMRCGDDVPLRTGHMTLNPFVHIPRMAWIMFALFGFTWGLMPVNPSNFRGRYDEAKVAFAGPAVNLMLFGVCVCAAVLWRVYAGGVPDPVGPNMAMFLYIGGVMNAMGFLFNLVPIPPLDGSRILADFFPGYRRIWHTEQAAFIGLIAFGVLFFYGAGMIWGVAFEATARVIAAGAGALSGGP